MRYYFVPLVCDSSGGSKGRKGKRFKSFDPFNPPGGPEFPIQAYGDVDKLATTRTELFSYQACRKWNSCQVIVLPRSFEVQGVCSNLVCIAFGSVHLAIVYEHAQWGKKLPGSHVFRKLLRKFTQVDTCWNLTSWGRFFTSTAPKSLQPRRDQSQRRNFGRQHGQARATRVLDNLDANTPVYIVYTCLYPSSRRWPPFASASPLKLVGKSQDLTKGLEKFSGQQQHRPHGVVAAKQPRKPFSHVETLIPKNELWHTSMIFLPHHAKRAATTLTPYLAGRTYLDMEVGTK